MWWHDDRPDDSPLFSILAIALMTSVQIGIGIGIGWIIFS
jgi:hypothetical protein